MKPEDRSSQDVNHQLLTEPQITNLFHKIRTWSAGDQRAPHKPLLLLMALARVQRGDARLMSYAEIEEPLKEALDDFGPPRKAQHPEQPFGRLAQDGIWELVHAAGVEDELENKAGPSASALRKHDVRGGLTPDIWDFLSTRPDIVNRLAANLLERTFPPSIHEAILDSIGFPWVAEKRSKRDPGFREAILRIYEHRCAFCGYDGRLGRADLGLEAAHIKWHAYNGPDSEDNGLALCSFHHKVFDRGALSISDDLRILVSQDVHGQTMVDEFLVSLIGRRVREPQSGAASPAEAYLGWHRDEVFRGPARVAP